MSCICKKHLLLQTSYEPLIMKSVSKGDCINTCTLSWWRVPAIRATSGMLDQNRYCMATYVPNDMGQNCAYLAHCLIGWPLFSHLWVEGIIDQWEASIAFPPLNPDAFLYRHTLWHHLSHKRGWTFELEALDIWLSCCMHCNSPQVQWWLQSVKPPFCLLFVLVYCFKSASSYCQSPCITTSLLGWREESPFCQSSLISSVEVSLIC